MDQRIIKDIFDRNIKRSSVIFTLVIFVCIMTLAAGHDETMSSLMLGLPVFMLIMVNFNEINPQWSDRVVTCLPVKRNSVASARWLMLVMIPFFFIVILASLLLIMQSPTSVLQQKKALVGLLVNAGIWLPGLYTLIRMTDLIKKTGWIIHPIIQTFFGIFFGLVFGGSLFIYVGLNALWNNYPILQPALWVSAVILVPISYYLTQIHILPIQVTLLQQPDIQIQKKDLPAFQINGIDRWFSSPLSVILTRFFVLIIIFSVTIASFFWYTKSNQFYPMIAIIYVPFLAIASVQQIMPIRLYVSFPVSRVRIFWSYVLQFIALSVLTVITFFPIWLWITDEPINLHLIALVFINVFYLYFLMNSLALEIENMAILFPFIYGAFFGVVVVISSANTAMITSPAIRYFLWTLFITLAIFSPYQLWRTLSRSSNPYKHKIGLNPQEINHQR